MARKYTILKVLLQNSSKVQTSDQGFTLIELMFGLLIMVLVGGFAMNALISASSNFNSDKRSIDSSQNLSAIMELVGNDIKASGEQITDSRFPVITIEDNAGGMPGSSKVTIRRALVAALTLCEDITSTSSTSTLLVAANSATTSEANCNGAATVSTTNGTTTITRPTGLRDARDYRCKLDDPNGNYSSTTSDFCNATTSPAESVLAAMTDGAGNIRAFRYINDNQVAANDRYNIAMPATQSLSSTFTASAPTATASYAIGNAIYLIEERVYTLDSSGNFKLQIDRGSAETLIKGIDKFNVAAKLYSDTTAKTISTAPVNGCASNTTVSYYSCTYSANTTGYAWKNIAGVKVELQAKYDATGRASTNSVNAGDIAQVNLAKDKLTAQAEFFPRNVLSK